MLRILLAEDDESMRVYLARALERVGYQVVAVDRGTAALPLLESEPFDLLLTDIVMPEMDGIELAQKAAEIAPDIRVMFITGFAAVALKAGRKTPERQGPLQALPPAATSSPRSSACSRPRTSTGGFEHCTLGSAAPLRR